MAEYYRFFPDSSGDRLYSAADVNEYLYNMLEGQEGVLQDIDNELAVTNDGTLSVDINTGAATKQGALYINDASLHKSLNTVSSGNKRYDRIVVRLSYSPNRNFVATIITGVEGTSPAVPNVVAATDVLLAKILIDRSSGTYAYTVTDEREYRPYVFTSSTAIASAINLATNKTELADADELGITDSAASYVLKKLTIVNFAANLWTRLGALIAGGTNKSTIVDADKTSLSDSASSNATKYATAANWFTYISGKLYAWVVGLTAKTTPVDADSFHLADSAGAASKKLTWANLKATLWAAWGALVNSGTSKTTPVDADAITLMDSADSNATKKLTWANLVATIKTALGITYTSGTLTVNGSASTGNIPSAAGKSAAENIGGQTGATEAEKLAAAIQTAATSTAEVTAAPAHWWVLAGGALKRMTHAGWLALVRAEVAPAIEAGTATATPADTDVLPSVSSVHAAQKSTWAQIKTAIYLKLYDWIIALSGKSTPVDTDVFQYADKTGGASKIATWGELKTALNTYFDKASTTVKGIVQFAVDGGTTAGTVVQGNDHRILTANKEFVYRNRKAVPTNPNIGAMFYAKLSEDVLDEKTGGGTFTRSENRIHPIYGHTLASNSPAFVPYKPGGPCDYTVIENYFIMAVSAAGLLYGVLQDTFANQKILKSSSDNGLTWMTVYTFDQRIRDVHITPAGTILVSIADDEIGDDAATALCKIYRSTDGSTFAKVLDIAAGAIVQWGFSSYTTHVLACTYGGRTVGTDARYVYHSADDGATWALVKDFGTSWGGHIHRASYDPYNAGHAYMLTGDVDANCTVLKSTNYGVDWTEIFSNGQQYRFVGINYDANYVYLGGDGKHDVGGGALHFAIYKFDRASTLTRMTVTYGPIYEIWKDQAGQFFAFGLNDQVDTTDNVARVYALNSGGTWDDIKDFPTPAGAAAAGFSKVFHYKNYVYAMCNLLLTTHDYPATLIFNNISLNKTMVRVDNSTTAGSAEKISWVLPTVLPQSFSVFLVVHFPVVSGLGSLNYIVTINKDTANMFALTVGSTRVFSFSKRKTGESTVTVSGTSGDIADGDTVVVCLRQNSANYISIITRLASGRYRRSAQVPTSFAHDAAIQNLTTGYTSPGYEPAIDLGGILVCYRYCDDGEAQQIMEDLLI